MGRQSKTKRPEFVGKGKLTPVQVAFLLDRYLSDNSFTQTRSSFRSEASHLISKSSVQEAPRSLLSLGEILEEYINLKEQKLWVNRERCRLEQENIRVRNFLTGMQNVMNAYSSGTNHVIISSPQLPPPIVASGVRAEDGAVTAGGHFPLYKSPSMISVSKPLINRTDSNNFTTPVTSHATTKRKGSKDVSGDTSILKKSRSSTHSKDVKLVTQATNAETNREKGLMNSVTQSSPDNAPVNGSQVQGSNVVKCLFNQKTPVNSPVPKTPPQPSSFETEKSMSPTNATFSKEMTPQWTRSTNCTIISSETIQVSPSKQIAYYSIEQSNCISTCSPVKANTKCSTNVKNHVKGRLNFDASDAPTITDNQTPDGTSASESDKEGDMLDLDFPNLDDMGLDFNLSEFLLEFEKENERQHTSAEQELNSSPDCYTGVPGASGNVLNDSTQHILSDMTGILGDKDMNLMGPGSIATMRSITKRVILSPVKSQKFFRSGEYAHQKLIG